MLSNGNKVIRARYPWAKDSQIGDIGVNSKDWMEQIASEVPDAINKNDGYIYLPLDQFKLSF